MAIQNPNNYHWSEINISEWAEKFLREKLYELGFAITELKSNIYVTQRMNSVNTMYFITGKLTKDDKSISFKDFDNYSDLSDIDGDPESGNLFLHVVEDMKSKAKSEFSEKILVGKSDDQVRTIDPSRGVSKVCEAVNQKYENLSFDFRISCSQKEFLKVLSTPENIEKWSGGQGFFEDGQTKLVINENVSICFEDGFPKKFKMNVWEKESDLYFNFVSYGNSVVVTIQQKNIPTGNIDTVKGFWVKSCIEPICECFGFTYYIH